MAIYTFWKKDFGALHKPMHIGTQEKLLAIVIGGAIGFYDGLFGPGTGSFLIFLFIRCFAFDFGFIPGVIGDSDQQTVLRPVPVNQRKTPCIPCSIASWHCSMLAQLLPGVDARCRGPVGARRRNPWHRARPGREGHALLPQG
ncbi:TSUP family transporter [Pseudomonas sp. MPB26]|uniref:TSUP family transporter n=1 Tax=Pseudomonas sp. MPB26 TaxID=3388491 RepID=UPI00398551F4